jgi:pimeloyl-ACP methyl ester carboxylesterase
MTDWQDRYSDATGVRIRYLYWPGNEHAIVIVHGNMHCGGLYVPLARRFAADGFTVASIDLRGHGLSDKPETGYGWDYLRDDVAAVARGLDAKDVFFVAHSRGGGASLLAATLLPELTRGVLAFEPSVPVTRTKEYVENIKERALARRSAFPDRQAMYDHYRRRGAFKGWREEYFLAYLDHAALQREDGSLELASPPWATARLYDAIIDPRGWEGAATSNVPVRLVYGEKGDRLGPLDPSPTIKAIFPNASLITMADATHSGPMEHPDVFERMARDFWAEIAP